MTPTWPQLAGWVALARPQTLSGRWRRRSGGALLTGTFAFTAPDTWLVLDEDGRAAPSSGPQHLLRGSPFERGDDYHRPVGPVTATEHDGRPCWQVTLAPPPHKRGALTLLVDAGTGLVLQQRNDEHDVLVEVLDLRVDEPLDEAVRTRATAQAEARAAEQALQRLVLEHPPPTPRWFPWRRGYADGPDCWVVEADTGEGSVGRAPLGEAAPVGGDWEDQEELVVRLDQGGWSWAVAADPPLDPAAARRVVDGVLEGRPYDG